LGALKEPLPTNLREQFELMGTRYRRAFPEAAYLYWHMDEVLPYEEIDQWFPRYAKHVHDTLYGTAYEGP
jgi:hypothetical protein